MTMNKNVSLSIFVPSYNEEENLEATINEVTKAIGDILTDYEFIIINDCSKDRTGEIADRLQATNPHVRAIHNPKNLGLGGSFRRSIELATKEYFIMVPGDNELNPDSVRHILGYVGQADMVIPYPENVYFRPYLRQILSTTFTALLNWVSGFHMGYYNGALLLKTSILTQVSFKTNGFAFQAEFMIFLLRKGYSFIQVPFRLNYASKRLTALRFKNVMSVISTLLRLIFAYRLFPATGKKAFG